MNFTSEKWWRRIEFGFRRIESVTRRIEFSFGRIDYRNRRIEPNKRKNTLPWQQKTPSEIGNLKKSNPLLGSLARKIP